MGDETRCGDAPGPAGFLLVMAKKQRKKKSDRQPMVVSE